VKRFRRNVARASGRHIGSDGLAGRSRNGRWAAVASAVVLVLLAACTEGTSGLVGPTWRWTNLTENAPLAHSDVADPDRYTLTLADDGSFQVRADCNTVAGTYVTDGDEITLSLGPSTLVACPEDSQADQFVGLLHTVSTFGVEGDELALHLADRAGTMRFEAAG
jgi:heat shock protein HslJ